MRWPEPDGARADLSGERVLRTFELRVAGVEPAPFVVVVGVVADHLTVGHQVADDLGRRVEGLADDEERALHVGGVEDLHDRRRCRHVRTVVEGDRDLARGARPVNDSASEPRRSDGARSEIAGESAHTEDERAPERERAQPMRAGQPEATEPGDDRRNEHGCDRAAEHHGA